MEMEKNMITCNDFSFYYMGQSEPAISDVSFSVKEGEWVLLCGESGSGKTTLLKQLQPLLSQAGIKKGKICIEDKEISQYSQKELVTKIGYVGQNPETQIVTDKVFHEMAFGLENLGVSREDMHRRIGEMSEYFGISSWFHKPVNQLSGGQKQILNLASVMVMRPKILLLDEPTSSLDPIAARRFFETIRQLNKDFGITIVISEQRLEEIVPQVDRILCLEKGRIIADTSPQKAGGILADSPVFPTFPVATRIASALEKEKMEMYPVTIAQGRAYLQEKEGLFHKEAKKEEIIANKKEKQETVISLKNIVFGYDKTKDILKEVSLDVKKGELLAIVGGNGAGKSTLLKVISDIEKASEGKKKTKGKICYLPQNPQSLFVEISVEEELADSFKQYGKKAEDKTNDEKREAVEQMIAFLGLQNIRHQNPYDISGGQMQRLALGKLLLMEPDILLLDEPTKGLDGEAKKVFASLLSDLQNQGKTVVMVSHDLTFVAEYMQTCAMFFDGKVLCHTLARKFLADNYFYTTPVCRMTQGILPDCIIVKDVISNYKEKKCSRNGD